MKGILVKTGEYYIIVCFDYISFKLQCSSNNQMLFLMTSHAKYMYMIPMIGKYREGNESSIDPPPSAICENFSSAVDLILSNLGSLDRT